MIRLLSISPTDPEPGTIARAAAVLRAGGLVAFPTETVYGLGANALDPVALARIFEAKGRPATNPLIVHVASPTMAGRVVASWPALAARLAEAFWPGPLTLVLPRRSEIPDAVSAGLPAVGVRMPAHPVALALIQAAGVPVAAPSANPYMALSPTTAAHVVAGLGDKVSLILDAGPTVVGLESTVLDLTQDPPVVLRPGGLPIARLRALLGEVHQLPTGQPAGANGPARSPGQARRHYAPHARLTLVSDAAMLATEARRLLALGVTVAAIPRAPLADAPAGLMLAALPVDPEGYGARLYATLHELDARGINHVLVEAPPADEAWAAVLDRLTRATAEI